MSRRVNCWDNAVAESIFSSLKKERIRKRINKTRDLARADVFDYIEAFYNRKRRHSHLGGISPEAFERASIWDSRFEIVYCAWEVQLCVSVYFEAQSRSLKELLAKLALNVADCIHTIRIS